jgi:hypothetical protein
LTKEEILNLFLAYKNQTFFFDIQEHLMTAESEVLLLTNRFETVLSDPNDENSEEITLKPAVERWKEMIGKMDPAEAKTE